jgi:uncharacterized protein (TIGR00251 family)
VRAAIRVKPGASRTFVGGSYAAPDGPALVVAVNSPAVEGKATAAALKALAKALGVRAADVQLVSGHTSRTKVVDVPDSCRARWAELLG